MRSSLTQLYFSPSPALHPLDPRGGSGDSEAQKNFALASLESGARPPSPPHPLPPPLIQPLVESLLGVVGVARSQRSAPLEVRQKILQVPLLKFGMADPPRVNYSAYLLTSSFRRRALEAVLPPAAAVFFNIYIIYKYIIYIKKLKKIIYSFFLASPPNPLFEGAAKLSKARPGSASQLAPRSFASPASHVLTYINIYI